MARQAKLAVMFTDMLGYTARSAGSSQQELLDLLRLHNQLIVPILERHGGHVIKNIGDSFMVAFGRPSEAVLAAYHVQKRLTKWNNGLAESDQIVVRIGIHAGTVTQVDGDLYGDVVNLASRIESICKPGEVFFSAVVARAAQRRGIPVVEMGAHELKGIPGPVTLFKIRSRGMTGKLEGIRALVHRSGAFVLARWTWRGLTLVPLLPILVVAIGWLSPWFAAIAMLYLIAWLALRGTRWALVRLAAAAIALVLTVLGPWGVEGLQARLDAASARVRVHNGRLSLCDKLGVWMLSLTQNTVYALRQPGEHSLLQLAAHLPKTSVIERSTDFPMQLTPVRHYVDKLSAQVRRSQDHSLVPPPFEVDLLDLGEAPLSRLVVRSVANRDHTTRWIINIIAEGQIGYAGNGTIALGDGRLRVDRRVLAHLQRQGWLFARDCQWIWQVDPHSNDDMRLTRVRP